MLKKYLPDKCVLLTDPSMMPLSSTVRCHGCPWSHLPQTVPPHRDVHDPIPKTCDYVTFCSKRNFTNVVMSRVLRWGGDPEVSRWAGRDHRASYKREKVREERGRPVAGFEDGGRGCERRWPPEAEKGQKRILPWSLQECSPAGPF